MNKNELDTAINIAKSELKKLAHESMRPNQGFKMRTNGPIMSSLVTCITYWEDELSKEEKVITKTQPKTVKKED